MTLTFITLTLTFLRVLSLEPLATYWTSPIGFLMRHFQLNMSQMEFSCHLLLHVFPQVSSYHSSPARHPPPCSRQKPEQCPISFLFFTQIYSMRKTCQFPPNYLISECFSPPHLVPLSFQLPSAPPWTSAKPLAVAGVTSHSRFFSGSLCLVLTMAKLALHNQTPAFLSSFPSCLSPHCSPHCSYTDLLFGALNVPN